MNPVQMLYVAALLITGLGIAHSILGERFILIRLFRRANLPKLFGSTDFTIRTLRFAWHFTTVLALGIAVLLVRIAKTPNAMPLASTIGWTLLGSGLLPLIHTRGHHLAWLVLFVAGGCVCWQPRPKDARWSPF
ncbi:MAG: hypothetical protein ABIR16_08255 [Dokdonella sp.]